MCFETINKNTTTIKQNKTNIKTLAGAGD